MAPSLLRPLLAVLSAVLMAGALYSALWVVSSSSLAFTACDGEYSLFAESPRCRQPYVAAIFAAVLFGASIAAMYARGRVGKTTRRSNERA
jgi:enoyl-CoA hydratase/carnithine racemase